MDVFALAGRSSASSGPLVSKDAPLSFKRNRISSCAQKSMTKHRPFPFWTQQLKSDGVKREPDCAQMYAESWEGRGSLQSPSTSLLRGREQTCPLNQTPALSGAEPSLVRWDLLSFWPICGRIGLVGPEPPCPAAPRCHSWILLPPTLASSHREGEALIFTTFDSKSFVLIGVLSQDVP